MVGSHSPLDARGTDIVSSRASGHLVGAPRDSYKGTVRLPWRVPIGAGS